MFVNRCIQRMPDDLPLTPPLQCTHCQQPFPLRAHFPLLGYFLSDGHCSHCQHPISLQPLIVDLLVIGSTLAVGLWRPLPQGVIDLLFIYTLILITMIDWNTLSIEPRVIVIIISVRLSWLILFERDFFVRAIIGLLVGAGAFYFIGFFYETLRRRQGLGDGDAAVLGLIGLWVGWASLHWVVLIAALSGILIGVTRLIAQKQSIADTPIPFAPFLCLGGGIVYFLQNLISAENIRITDWFFVH